MAIDKNFHKWRWRFLTAWVVVFTGVAAWNFHAGAANRHSICEGVNNLNAVISQTLQRSKQNLDRLDYYRTHPAEKRQQQREIDRTLRLFEPRRCS